MTCLKHISSTLNKVVDRLGKCESRMATLEKEIDKQRSTPSSCNSSSPETAKKVPCVIRVSQYTKVVLTIMQGIVFFRLK